MPPMTSKSNDDPYSMSTANPSIEKAYSPGRGTFRTLAYAAFLCFVPHDRNSPTRKYVTTTMFVTWGVITIMQYLGHAPAGARATEIYWALTVVVFSVMSHLWGFEYGVLSSVTVDASGDDDGEGGE